MTTTPDPVLTPHCGADDEPIDLFPTASALRCLGRDLPSSVDDDAIVMAVRS